MDLLKASASHPSVGERLEKVNSATAQGGTRALLRVARMIRAGQRVLGQREDSVRISVATGAALAAVVAAVVVWLATRPTEEPLDPGEFEARRAACGAAPDDPRLFIHQAFTGSCQIDPSLAEKRQDRLSIQVESESETESVVVATLHAQSDDSVESERTRFWIRRGDRAAGGWRIVRVRLSWACWAGRGHRGYGTTPCS